MDTGRKIEEYAIDKCNGNQPYTSADANIFDAPSKLLQNKDFRVTLHLFRIEICLSLFCMTVFACRP